jgi:acyl-CoA thioesterase FadM
MLTAYILVTVVTITANAATVVADLENRRSPASQGLLQHRVPRTYLALAIASLTLAITIDHRTNVYQGSARLDEVLAVEVAPTRAGRTSLSMSFTVRGGVDASPIVIGHATYVAVAEGGAVELPARLRRVISGLA